jgi:hypothetical protein
MLMRVTTYTYPWDLARLGVERVVRQMADEGIDVIDLAATYHPIDSLSPRGGVRLFSSGRGAVYFPARTERYGRIRPSTHSVCAVWPDVAKQASTLGLALNAWTVTLFQPWIRDAHPDCARVLPGGDRSGSGVCPANDDVRDYLATLCADVVDQFGVRMVRLEGVIPHTFDLDWLRPRVLVDIPALARTLLNLCFCGACTRRTRAAGLDVERLRRVVNDAIDAEISEGQTDASADRAAKLAADHELHAFVTQNVQSSIELVRTVASRLKGTTRISTNASTPYVGLLGAAAEEALLAQIVGTADQIALHPNAKGNRGIVDLTARATPPRELSMLFARVRVPGSTGPAPVASSEQLAKELTEAVGLGVDEVTLYNYALLPEREVHEFVTAVRRATPQDRRPHVVQGALLAARPT